MPTLLHACSTLEALHLHISELYVIFVEMAWMLWYNSVQLYMRMVFMQQPLEQNQAAVDFSGPKQDIDCATDAAQMGWELSTVLYCTKKRGSKTRHSICLTRNA